MTYDQIYPKFLTIWSGEGKKGEGKTHNLPATEKKKTKREKG